MANLACGLDFGTSNSSLAVAGDNQVTVLELDPLNDNPTSLPSILYISSEGEAIVGRAAANAFIERNVDREVKLEQIDLGIAIEGCVAGELDNDAGRVIQKDTHDTREAMRARATIEVNSPGRLFQSLKSSLRYTAFKGTEVFGQHYQIEELVAIILKRMKQAADVTLNGNVSTAVIGRPVRFSFDERDDELAQRRLETAARLAGFENVVFFYEPVAACVEYAVTTDKRQRLMVVDIGGGTCDVCVMEFGGSKDTAARLSESQILGVSGLPVAGDAIDKEIIRAKLYPRFGSRSRYGPSNLPVPQFLMNMITDWQNLYKLNTEETINWLIAMEMSSTEPDAIRALRYLVQRNYGYPVAREVEAAKKRLSDTTETTIELHREAIQISEQLERTEFTHIIEHMLEQMQRCIEEAETEAQVTPNDIDFVLTTGGTSLIPAIRSMLEERYGIERMLQRDTFTSVASGLAVVAKYI